MDQIAKINAARSNPPIDVMLMDPGPALTAPPRSPTPSPEHVLQEPAPERAGADGTRRVLQAAAQLQSRRSDAAHVMGRPLEAGGQGASATNMNSTLGTGFMVESLLRGGSEANLDPAFKAWRS